MVKVYLEAESREDQLGIVLGGENVILKRSREETAMPELVHECQYHAELYFREIGNGPLGHRVWAGIKGGHGRR